MRINYKITLLGYWHCGSGLSSGAIADSVVIKDEKGLPYIPGKTMKGLFRDSITEIAKITDKKNHLEKVMSIFGMSAPDNDPDKESETIRKSTPGRAKFSNAILGKNEAEEAVHFKEHLFRILSSTSIDEMTGTARQKSLRSTEVCIPVELYGSIQDLDESDLDAIETGIRCTRAIGAHRNRGLGRCRITIEKKES
jgi:CRISPR/Cas system CSM-associated protein Csm3 (group 7 of RAMP superfamily)